MKTYFVRLRTAGCLRWVKVKTSIAVWKALPHVVAVTSVIGCVYVAKVALVSPLPHLWPPIPERIEVVPSAPRFSDPPVADPASLPVVVPEPSGLLVLAVGAGAAMTLRRRVRSDHSAAPDTRHM